MDKAVTSDKHTRVCRDMHQSVAIEKVVQSPWKPPLGYVQSIHDGAYGRNDIRGKIKPGRSRAGERERGETERVDTDSDKELCSEGNESLPFTVHYHKVVEHVSREGHVQREISHHQSRGTKQSRIEVRYRSQRAAPPHTKHIRLKKLLVSSFSTLVGHEGVVNNAEGECE